MPSEDAVLVTSPLRCLFTGPFRDLPFNVGDHRLIPVHDVVFLDDFERNVKPLIYRPVTSEVAVVAAYTGQPGEDQVEQQQSNFCSSSR